MLAGMHVPALPRAVASGVCSLLAAAALALLACGTPPATQPRQPTAPVRAPLADDIARLVLPVSRSPGFQDDIAAALSRLQVRAESGSASAPRAAWARVHYLLDLFDDARLRHDPHSLALLHRVLGTPPDAPRQGRDATDAALQALAVMLDAILARDRLHADAQGARALVAWDLDPPVERAAVHGRLEVVEAVARGGSAVAANARLRLYAYCRQALDDAQRARRADRMRLVAHCLYPLYPVDPAPYFAEDPAARPPPPDWRALLADLDRLLAAVVDDAGRMSVTGQALRAELAELEPALDAALPALPDPVALGLARVDHGPPYDDTPLVALPHTAQVPAAAVRPEPALADTFRAALAEDGRQVLTAVIPAVAPAADVLAAAELASRAGAAQLALLAWKEQALPGPAHASADAPAQGRVRRLVALPLSLSALAAPPALPDTRPTNAAHDLGLHLVIDRETWRLTSATGEVAALATSSETTDPTAALQAELARVRSAFAAPQALVLVPGKEATAGALITAAAAALAPHQGQPLVASLGLARRAPTPRASTLARRIERRAGASVDIVPAELAVRAPIVRACYQDVLDSRPGTGGTVRLERRGERLVVTGPADRGLRACVESALGPAMRERGIPSATATLRPQVP
jgi:hypothetical protein